MSKLPCDLVMWGCGGIVDGVDGVASTHRPCDTRPIELGCTAIEALDPCIAVVDVGLGHRLG